MPVICQILAGNSSPGSFWHRLSLQSPECTHLPIHEICHLVLILECAWHFIVMICFNFSHFYCSIACVPPAHIGQRVGGGSMRAFVSELEVPVMQAYWAGGLLQWICEKQLEISTYPVISTPIECAICGLNQSLNYWLFMTTMGLIHVSDRYQEIAL